MADSVVTRVKPNSLEAEQSVIGALIMDSSFLDETAEIIQREDFYYQHYGIVFEAIIELTNEGITPDLVTITDRLVRKNAPLEIRDGEHLKYLAESVPIVGNVLSYAQIVKNKSLLRQIIDKNREIEELCFSEGESVENILDTTEQNFLALLQRRGASDATPIGQIVNNAMEKIYEAYENKADITGIPTGFIDLDSMTAGMQRSDLILVAARPSMGKTAFALNIASYVVLKRDLPVVIFSLEMSQESLVNRLFSIDSGIDAKNIRTGDLEDYEWPRLEESAKTIGRSKLIIDEAPSITISEIRSKCRKYKQQQDIQLVVIDYLQLISSNGNQESRQQEISNISRSLKALARELDIPVIALSQLNRGVEQREDKRPMLSDLRDSGAIEQDADVVMLLYRDDYYNKDESKEKGISEIIVAKQRNGPTGTIRLKWLAKYTRFVNLERARNQIASVYD